MAGPHRWIKTTPSNWEAASFDTGLLPASTEIVRFDGTAQGDVIGGLDQSAVDLALLQINRTYRGRIGAPGNPLIVSSDLVLASGSGQLNYRDGNGTTDVFIVDSDNLVDAVHLGGTSITRIRVLKGRVDIDADFGGANTLEIGYRNMPDVDANVVANDGLTALFVVNLIMNAGRLTSRNFPYDAATAQAIIHGGVLTVKQGDAVTTGTTYLVGGTLRWNATAPSGVAKSLAGRFYLISGTLDATEGGAKTIDDAFLWGGTIVDPNGNLTITENRMEP